MSDIFSIIQKKIWWAGIILLLAVVGVFFGLWRQNAEAVSINERVITIHDGEQEKTIITKATTVSDVLRQAKVSVLPDDMVDPMLETRLTAKSYQVNIYRARPVLVVDGNTRQTVMTPYDTARQIIEKSGLAYYDEDEARLTRTDDILHNEGVSDTLTIKRATVFNFMLYGKMVEARTQAKTIGDMLKEKNIKLSKTDTVTLPLSSPIISGMTVKVWREGVQTITEEVEVPFAVQQIKDINQPVGYKQVKTPGVSGRKVAVFEVEMKNGQEIARREIQSVQTQAPQDQVEVVGAKPSFSGDFAAALAKLRSCEGGYNSWNSAGPYYGAYQFDQSTWDGVADPSKYGNASPEEQDAAAHRLYLKRGWQPWPKCGAAVLPDVYR